jgi:hypothetical protein
MPKVHVKIQTVPSGRIMRESPVQKIRPIASRDTE